MLDPGSPALLRNLLQQSFKIPSVRLSYNYFPLPWRLVRLRRRGDEGEGEGSDGLSDSLVRGICPTDY